MRRAALYARVSTEMQEKEQTIQSQLAAITRYAEQQGFQYSEALTYTDDGYSGTWLDRPALDELRDHAREGRFDAIVMLCPDRLARRYAYQVLILEELRRAGIEVHFCERPIQDTPDDQLLLQIQGAIAEYERAKVLDRCRRGRLHRARRGELAPPSTPYGYTYAARKYGGDGQIRIDEQEAAMVRQVFEWYAEEGSSVQRVLKKLNASSWKTRRGRKEWAGVCVLRMLRCEWYVGRAYYNRITRRPQSQRRDELVEGGPVKTVVAERPQSEWIVVPVPRLLDDELFERVQGRLVENQRFAKRRLRRKQTYLLRGLLKCGQCGYAYVGLTQASSYGRPGYHYYRCNARYASQRLMSAIPEPCTNALLRGDGVDEVVWTTVRRLLLNSETLTHHLHDWLERATSDAKHDERLKLARSRLKELNSQRERLIDAYQMGALPLDDFRTRRTSIEERILAVEQEQAELRSWQAKQELAARQVAGAEGFAEHLREQLRRELEDPDFEVKQAILRLVVEKVVITGQRLEIHLAVPVSGSYELRSTRGASRSVSNFCRSFNCPPRNLNAFP
jgi:site-specific DNA recombinase